MNVLYEGPSLLDGKPIFMAMTGLDRPSENRKTGPMVQTWILRADLSPEQAIRSGEDESVCGTCPLRARICYVLPHYAPATVYKAKQVALEKQVVSAIPALKFRSVRIGAYGNASAVPFSIWEGIIAKAAGYTSYIYNPLDEWQGRTMASVHSPEQAKSWQAKGFKTFRVKQPGAPLLRNEVPCPYPRLRCIDCQLCTGSKVNVAVDIHGASNRVNAFRQLPT